MAENRLEGIPPAGVYTSRQVAEAAGLTFATLNRVALALGRSPGSGARLRWSYRDLQGILVALRIESAGAGDGLPIIASTVLGAPVEPRLSGWVAYRQGIVRYGATPSEAIGPYMGVVVACLRRSTIE